MGLDCLGQYRNVKYEVEDYEHFEDCLPVEAQSTTLAVMFTRLLMRRVPFENFVVSRVGLRRLSN